jgi:hypothetical protein
MGVPLRAENVVCVGAVSTMLAAVDNEKYLNEIPIPLGARNRGQVTVSTVERGIVV